MLRSLTLGASLAVLLTAAATGPAAAGPIETAYEVLSTTNLYVIGDMGAAGDRYGSDVEGRTVVGGSVYTGNFTFGSASPGETALIVGGSLDHMNGEIRGNAIVGGDVRLQSFAVHGELSAGGNAALQWGSVNGPLSVGGSTSLNGVGVGATVPYGPSDALDTALLGEALKAAADSLGTLEANGTFRMEWGDQLILTGTDADFNVFTLDGAQLANLSRFRIEAPEGSTVLINVTGETVIFDTSFGLELVGLSAEDLLFNFFEATVLDLASLRGSILAPGATANFAQGQIKGSVVVGTLTNGNGSGGEFHNKPFNGTLPKTPDQPPVAVPEPASLAVFGVALVAAAIARRRGRR